MKNIFLYVVILLLVGCISQVIEEKEVVSKSFMSEKQITEEYHSLTAPGSKALYELQEDSPAEKKKKRLLVDLNDFFPKSLREEEKGGFRVQEEACDIPNIDLRYCDTPIRRQIRGWCTAHSGAAWWENIICHQNKNKKPAKLSTTDLFKQYNKYSSHALVNTWQKPEHKVCDEKYCPIKDNNTSEACKPKKHAYMGKILYLGRDGAALCKVYSALKENQSIYLAMRVMDGLTRGHAVVPPGTLMTNGGHAMVIVGTKKDSEFCGGGYAILKNSWGTQNGDSGYNYMPLCEFERSDGYAYFWKGTKAISTNIKPPNCRWVKKKYKKCFPGKGWLCWFKWTKTKRVKVCD